MIVKSIMTVNPVTIRPDVPVFEARQLMETRHVHQLPVLDHKDRVVGIVANKDLNKASPSPATTLDMYEISYLLSKITVSKVMSTPVVTVEENVVVEEAARIMVDNSVNSLPVMRSGALSGIITGTDLLRVFIDAFGAREEGIRFTVDLDEKPGQIAQLGAALASKGGNIAGLITMNGSAARKRVTVKVSSLTRSDVEAIVKTIAGAILEDLRA